MSERQHDREQELLARLLDRAEIETPADHLDDETLVLFAQGALVADDRMRAIEHLADCQQCRRIASELMQSEQSEQPAAEIAVAPARASSAAGTLRYAGFALAACLLLAVTAVLFQPQLWPGAEATAERRAYEETRSLLASRQFSEARRTVAEATRQGTRSDRLQSLDAQAARGMTSAVALAQAGRLTDFGVDVTGAVGRAAQDKGLGQGLSDAQDSLANIGASSVEALLNRGHVALSAHRLDDALADFDAALRLAPSDPLAHVGRGLANYMNDDLPAAERDFRQALRHDPRHAAARINLAITLTEQGNATEARAQWQELLTLPLEEDDRAQAERAIELLREP